MKKVSVLLTVLAASLFFAGSVMAKGISVSPESSFRAEIVDMIDNPNFGEFQGESLVANLRLMVNEDHELIVIDTGTKDPELDSYLKSKLNYKIVKSPDVLHYNFYFIRVEFKV